MQFNPMEFIYNLKYMGVGLIGVFLIVGIIVAATYGIGKLSEKMSKKDE